MCNYNNILYILGVAFQCSGALLCLGKISVKRDDVIQSYFSRKTTIKDGNTGEIDYKEDTYKDEWVKAYQNKFGFLMIALGYFIPLFADNAHLCLTCILICALMTLFLLLMVKKIIEILSTKYASVKVTKEDVERLELDADFQTPSGNDIEDIFE